MPRFATDFRRPTIETDAAGAMSPFMHRATFSTRNPLADENGGAFSYETVRVPPFESRDDFVVGRRPGLPLVLVAGERVR